MSSNSVIFVSGALGNVGAEVVNALLASPAFQNGALQIRAGDLNPEWVHQRWGKSVEAMAFDFMHPETFGPALNGVRAMFLMRPPQISDVQRYIFPAIDAAKAAGVEQIVFLSLIGIEKNKIVPHYKVERYLRTCGIPYTFLRASFFMQNLNTTHRKEIRDQRAIIVPVGQARTSFIDVRDIGAIAALTLTQPDHAGHAYDLTGPEALDYNQVAELFTSSLGRKITYANPSLLGFFRHQRRQGTPLAFTLVMSALYTSTRMGMAAQVTSAVERLLGRPPVRMQQYIEDYRQSWL